jgi:hypothetical protein
LFLAHLLTHDRTIPPHRAHSPRSLSPHHLVYDVLGAA